MLPTTDPTDPTDPRSREQPWTIAINGTLETGYVFDFPYGHYAVWFVDGWRAPVAVSAGLANISTDRVLPFDDYFRIFPRATGEPRDIIRVARDDRPKVPSGSFTPEQIQAICSTAPKMLESTHDEPVPIERGLARWLGLPRRWLGHVRRAFARRRPPSP